MKERPILFSAPMVRALLNCTKSQTRRVVKPQPDEDGLSRPIGSPYWHDTSAREYRCPYGQPGDRLWVREAFIHEPADYCWEASVSIPSRPSHTTYRADCDGDTRGAGWKPSIHMPRNLSRIDLEITAVRVERLHDISETDARAEGIIDGGCLNCGNPEPCGCDSPAPDARESFCHLWQSINGEKSWHANPWVWVVEFRPLP